LEALRVTSFQVLAIFTVKTCQLAKFLDH